MLRTVLLVLMLTAAFEPGSFGAIKEGILLRAMSFNVRWDGLDQGKHAWNNRKPVVIDTIQKYAPDVVGLQEPSTAQTQDLDTALERYKSFQAPHERDQHITFLYRSDRFQSLGGGSFWLIEKSELPGGTRRCVWLHLEDKETGQAFYIFNNHFDHRSSESRQQSARSLAQGIQERTFNDPFIVLGDFNEGESGPAMQYLKGETSSKKKEDALLTIGPLLVDTFRSKHPQQLHAGSGHGFSGRRDGRRIDYIFVSSRDEILKAEIIHHQHNGLYPSDHFPVTATVWLNENGNRSDP